MIPFNTKILPGTKGVYMVGGSVRDLILGQRSTDYDIAVRGNPEKFARKLSENLSGRLVKMGKPGQVVFRVVSREHLFDISAIKGLNIETDLIQRDFTVNAMAYSFFSKTIILKFWTYYKSIVNLKRNSLACNDMWGSKAKSGY